MSNANSFGSLQLTAAPVPSTEAIALPASHSADTVRSAGLIGPDFDLSTGGQWDGKPFRLSVSGRVSVSASENITVAVYLNKGGNTNLTTLTNDVKVINTSTMASGAAGNIAFFYTAIGIWKSDSATTGHAMFYPEPGGLFVNVAGTGAALGAATAVILSSGTAIACTQAQCNFYVTTLTGTADATSVANIDFRIDQI